jgi:hypothetical protein
LGSAQEFVEARILGCFLKNDEFSLGDRHALSLEQQVAETLVAAAVLRKKSVRDEFAGENPRETLDCSR